MRKFMATVVTASLTVTFISGCGETNEDSASKRKPASSDEMLYTAQAFNEIAHYYSSVQEERDASDAVIYGEVTDYEFQVDNTFIYTLETVHVIESLYGDVSEGEDVVVLKSGGYMIARDFINRSYATDEERDAERNSKMFRDFSDQDLDTKFIAQIPNGYFSPETGNRSVFFLRKRDIPENTYEITGDAEQGEYIEVSDGILRNPSIACELSSKEEIDRVTTVPYEDLKAALQK